MAVENDRTLWREIERGLRAHLEQLDEGEDE
jgi:hypothetical protein